LLTQLADALTLQGVSCCIRSGHAAKKSEMCRFWRPANLHLTKFNTSEYALDKRIYHIRRWIGCKCPQCISHRICAQ
jgi:hypothetical protein